MQGVHVYQPKPIQYVDIEALIPKYSGSLSKWHWLAFIRKDRLKLNDFENSVWLDLIDHENSLAHIN